jgi:sugar phosphate isomerase/epimerase
MPAGPGLQLGLAGYSFRKLAPDAFVAAMRELDITHFSAFRTQLPILLGTPDECAAQAQAFKQAGLVLTGTGVVTLKNSEADMRRAFECGKAAGLKTMTASYAVPPTADALKLTERFVQEYDIRLAFHNHGPEDSIFPSPLDVWRAVEPYDPRLGLCIDVGHCFRAGTDPVAAIKQCQSRLYDVHMKDTLVTMGVKKDVPALIGKGRLDPAGILKTLLDIKYTHQVGLEHELDTPDPIPGVAQSYGYMRGVVGALNRTSV